MSDTHIVRVFLDRPDWQGIPTATFLQHYNVAGPDVFSPSNRVLVLSEYGEEMFFKEGRQSMVMCIQFTVWQPGQPVTRTVQNWESLFGELPIPRAEPDRGQD
jgi:hypothetical protein